MSYQHKPRFYYRRAGIGSGMTATDKLIHAAIIGTGDMESVLYCATCDQEFYRTARWASHEDFVTCMNKRIVILCHPLDAVRSYMQLLSEWSTRTRYAGIRRTIVGIDFANRTDQANPGLRLLDALSTSCVIEPNIVCSLPALALSDSAEGRECAEQIVAKTLSRIDIYTDMYCLMPTQGNISKMLSRRRAYGLSLPDQHSITSADWWNNIITTLTRFLGRSKVMIDLTFCQYDRDKKILSRQTPQIESRVS